MSTLRVQKMLVQVNIVKNSQIEEKNRFFYVFFFKMK